MNPMFSVITALLALMVTSVCFAAPTLTTPSTTNVGANMATLVLQSGDTGSGYFTLLYGSNASCGTGTQVKAGQTDSGAAAPYSGSLLLTANTDGNYTVRNLTQSTDYTVCFTADSPTGSNLNATPAKVNFTATAATAFISPDWRVVGSVGFSAGTANATLLAFAPDGTPYVAYVDVYNSYKTTVMKYSGNTWSVVGSAGFSAGNACFTSLAFAPDGTPYVAYQDLGNSSKATVMKYSAGAWSVVGSAGFSAGTAEYTSLAFAPDGTPHVAYLDYFYGGKVTVMKFSGGAWINVGNPGFSVADVGFISLAIAPDGIPHVAYSDYGNVGKVTVMKFSSGAWGEVGSAGFSAGPANSTSLAFAPDGTPYVAYGDDGNGSKATVMKFSGGAWVNAGSAGFSAGPANSTSLAFAPDGTPYVAYGDDGNSSKATVMKLDNLSPIISGTPAASATVGAAYSFTPIATYATGFSVTDNLPPGLSFNTATGSLSGTPTAAGTYSNIIITATNSIGSASLPAFTIVVGDATAPDTTITSFPPNPASSTSFSFAFTSTRPGSAFECSLGGGAYGTCSSPYSDSIVYAQCTICRIDTAMSFAVRAKDPAGNTDPTPASYVWTINNSIGAPFANVLDGGVVQLKATDFAGNLNLSRGVVFTLMGGYDSGYSTNSGLTNIHGTVTISAGTVIFENIVIM